MCSQCNLQVNGHLHVSSFMNMQEAMKNAKELIEEEERDRKKAEKRRAKKKVWFSFDMSLPRSYPQNLYFPF